MTITTVGTPTWTTTALSATSVAPTYPTGIGAGDLCVMFVHSKPATTTVTLPANWTDGGSSSSANGAGQAADAGDTKITMFYREAAGSLTGTQSVTLSGNNVTSATIHVRRRTAGSWATGDARTATKNTTGTAYTASTAAMALQPNDNIMAVIGITSDAPVMTVPTMAASGITFSAVSLSPATNVATGTGNDRGTASFVGSVTAGTATTAFTMGMTLSSTTGSYGPAAMFLLREPTPAAAISTLTDTFDTEDSVKWTGWDATTFVENNALRINTNLGSDTLTSIASYDMTGSSFYFELAKRPAIGTGTTEAWCSIGDGVNNFIELGWSTGVLVFREKVAGVDSDGSYPAYDAFLHKWGRMALSGTTVTWDTSPDGLSWTNQRSKTTTLNLTSIKVYLRSGYYGTESVDYALFDNVNTPPLVARRQPISVHSPAVVRSSTW